jgi:peptidoglycan pentaglycine glycine transferase (the first glycine)
MDERQREQWNHFVAQSPHFALMQSYEWGEFKERLGWRAIRLAVKQRGQITATAQLLIKPVFSSLFSVGYIPRGPLVDWTDTSTTAALLQALHSEARRHRVILTKIEPPLLNGSAHLHHVWQYGFQASANTNQPRATIVLDLTAGLDSVLANMSQKTRYNIRYADRKGVNVREGQCEDLGSFYYLLKTTSIRKRFPVRSWHYYLQMGNSLIARNLARLLLAEYEGQVIAGIIVAAFGDKAAYLYGASSNQYRNLMPNHRLQWEAINWAWNLGCKSYDLWGIPEEVGHAVYQGQEPPGKKRTTGLWGVYRFKRGFSRNVVYFVGAYDYIYSSLLYRPITLFLVNACSIDSFACFIDRLGDFKERLFSFSSLVNKKC